jgi:type IV/VI secretion system ImpK/VasF family protein
MKLLEIYEGLFQYICCLNRTSKTQAHPELARVRSEVRELLEQAGRSASADVRLANQVARLELPLIFFMDNLICTSRLKFASQWAEKRLAHERNELAGDERFFVDFLERDLTDPAEEAAERLAIYYVCLALGFRGMYQAQPEKIQWYMEQIFPRIRQWMDNDPRTKISEEAYRHTDTRRLTEPPSNKIALVAIAFVFLSLSVLVAYYALYAKAVKVLSVSVEKIVQEGKRAEKSTP